MITHTCIRPECNNTYQSEEVEPYYCSGCQESNKQVAAQIDKQVAARPRRETKSALQQYDESPKVRGFVHVKF